MLRYARERRSAISVLGDATRTPIANGSIDAVLLAYVLFHLPDPSAGVSEAARVLRPNGQVGTVTWANERPMAASQIWNRTLDRLGIAALPAHGNDAGLDTEEAMEHVLLASGLSPRRVWRETVEHTFAPDGFWRMRTGCGPNRARLAQVDAELLPVVLAELHDRISELELDDFTFRGEVICATARASD
jgi:SAM-dependent methyltransferase